MQTTINGYLVELDIDDDTTQCFINKGRGSASLECLLAVGTLDDDLPVAQSTIDAIEKWALANGY